MCNFCSKDSASDMIEFGEIDFGALGKFNAIGEIFTDNFLGNHLVISITGNNQMIFNKDVKISFCPMCGRNLQKKSVDN